jgi:hypothetical protein
MSYGIPRGLRAIRCELVWKSTWQEPAKGLAVEGAPDRPDDALWVNERYGLFSTVEQFDRTKPRGV